MTDRSKERRPKGRRGHEPPGPEESQPLAPRGHVPHAGVSERQREQSGGGGGFVTVNGRLYAPLWGLDPNNILLGGYGWLSMTDNGATYHPGLDLNSGNGCNDDEGAYVVAPLAGVVRAILYAPSGEGNHVWLELDDACLPGVTWLHVDHLQSVSVRVDQRLAPGETFAAAGRTGGWDCAHLHTELLKGPPRTGYWQWPYGWSRAQVEDEYWNPHEWWAAATALVLAEGQQPIPPEVVMLLSDWQVLHWILPSLFEWAGVEYNPDAGTSKAWVAELRAGRYRGRPRTGERPYGEGADIGLWQEWESGVLLYRVGDGQASWTG